MQDHSLSGRGGLLVVLAAVIGAGGAALAAETAHRSIDGTGNNEANPTWGSAERPLIRIAPLAYEDGYASPSGSDRPNPRLISITICQQNGPIPAARNTSDFLWAFGVFVNHDIDITEGGSPVVALNIPVPKGDPYFDPAATGTQEIPFNRGKTVAGTGTGVDNPTLLDNSDTAFLDLSTVYGSDPDRAAWLRTHVGGKLKTTSHPLGALLPFNDGTQFNLGNFEDPDYGTDLFLAGDVRCNVSAFLATMHTLWLRNHNWWAERFAAENPDLTDEELYQLARKRNIAELQNVALYQWLPALPGANAVPAYAGYDPEVDATAAVEFTTVVLRAVGHTLLPTEILRVDENGRTIPQGNVLLRDSFFDNAPIVVQSAGIDPILRGLAAKRCQESDHYFVDDIHHFLFTLPGAGGRDLIALNIQRGRDFGIPDYNTVREAYGLARKTSFSEITPNRTLAALLEAVYGDVDNLDPFIGAVCENHYLNGSVGELVHVGMLEQLLRARDGDRFWFESPGAFSSAELAEIRATKLSDVIKRNTAIINIQSDVFFVPRASRTPGGLLGQTAGASASDDDPNPAVANCGVLGLASLMLTLSGLGAIRFGVRRARGH